MSRIIYEPAVDVPGVVSHNSNPRPEDISFADRLYAEQNRERLRIERPDIFGRPSVQTD